MNYKHSSNKDIIRCCCKEENIQEAKEWKLGIPQVVIFYELRIPFFKFAQRLNFNRNIVYYMHEIN